MKKTLKDCWHIIAMCVLAILDTASTAWLLSRGVAVEGNPIVGFYISSFGLYGLLCFKAWMTFWLVFSMGYVHAAGTPFVKRGMKSLVALYVLFYTLSSLLLNYF